MRPGISLDFLSPVGIEAASSTIHRHHGQRSPYQRALFLLLSVVVILSNSSITPALLHAATSVVTESFTSTSNIDTASTTATVDTVHNQTRLTTTDAWTNVMGFENGDNLSDIIFAPGSSTTAWVVTQGGSIVKTTNGGVTWPRQSSGTALPLRAVSFVDSSNGWVVGGSNDNATGVVLKTTNGGSTWSAVTPTAAPTLLGVSFINTTTGWAVGTSGKIYSTTDGGSTWASQSVSGLTVEQQATFNFSGISLSGSTGIIVGSNSIIVKSTDTGATWTKRTPSGSPAVEAQMLSLGGNFSDVYMATSDIAWLVGDGGAIAKTTNASTSFTITFQSFMTTGNGGFNAAINAAYPGINRTIQAPLTSIHFASDNLTGIATGEAGALIKLTDGGSTLTSLISATNHTLNAVVMTSTSAAYVVGDIAIALATANGGTTWSNLTQARFGHFHDVAFTDADMGVMVGDESTVLVTLDASVASPLWFGIPTPSGANNWNSIGLVDNTTFWVLGDIGGIYYTDGRGFTWTSETSGVSSSLNDIHIASGSSPNITAYIVGNGGVIKKTTNGGNSEGATWSSLTSGTADTLRAVAFSPTTTTLGWAVGDNGALIATTDGGATWTSQADNSDLGVDGLLGYSFYGVKMVSDTTGWVVGSGGLILKTTDGGTTWTQQTSNTSVILTSVTVVDANTVWVTGQSGVIVSTSNGGTTWSAQTAIDEINLNAFAIASATNFWVAADQVTIVRSVNTGSSFTTFHTDTSPTFKDVDGSGSTVYASGFSGKIFKSTNTGSTWTELTSGTSNGLYGISVVDPTTAWSVGIGGTIIKTTNGLSWSSQASGTVQNLYDIDAVSASVAWAVGFNGTILMTTNEGSTWSAQTSNVTTSLNAVSAVDATTAFVAGTGGTILVTTNSGTTWVSQSGNARESDGTTLLDISGYDLNGISMVNATTGWVAGAGGLILKTTDGGTTWVQQTAPSAVQLNDVKAVDAQTAYIITNGGSVFHTVDGSTWTSVAGVFSMDRLWVGDFETVVAVGGGGHWAARYTPTYASPKIVVSANRHTNTSLGIPQATLTATSTLNSQAITYYMTNAITSVACGAGAPWQEATSGESVTFAGGASTALYWCAQLSSSSSTASPRLSQISISYETIGIRGGRGDDRGGCTTYCPPPPPPECTSVDCPPILGPSAPRADASQTLSGTSIQWNFTPTSIIASEYILSQKAVSGTLTDIIRKVESIVSLIVENELTPNTEYADRVIQSSNSAGTSTPTALPSTVTLSTTPPVPQLDSKSTSAAPAILVHRGDNPDYTDLAIHEKDNGYVLASGSFNRDQSHPEWRSFAKWGQAVIGNDGNIDSKVRRVSLSQLLPNRDYYFDLRSRNLKGVESTPTLATRIVSPIEEVKQVVVAEPVAGTVTMDITSVSASGEFSNVTIGDSGLWVEMGSDTFSTRSSGWIHESRWVVEGVPSGVYQVRVKARNQQGLVTPVYLTTAIVSGQTPGDVVVTPAVISYPQNNSQISQSPVTITGTSMIGSIVELTVDGVVLTLPVSNLGAWQSGALSLAEGTHTVSSVAKLGLTKATATQIQFTLGSKPADELPPAPPRILWPQAGSTVQSSDVVISGITPVGTIVELRVDGRVESIEPDSEGQWGYVAHLVDGVYEIEATSINAKAIRSLSSAGTTVIVDEEVTPIIPLAPVIEQPSNGATVKTRLVMISGRAPTNTAVVVTVSKEGATTTDEDAVIVDSEGRWNVSKNLVDGRYTISAYSMTNNGGKSTPHVITMRVQATIDGPVAPAVLFPLDNAKINTDTITFRGTAQSGSVVAVEFAGKDQVRSSIVGADRAWTATVDLEGVPDSTHDAWVRIVDREALTIVRGLTIDRITDIEEIILSAPIVRTPLQDSTIRSNSAEFRGTAQPGSVVQVRFAGQDPVRSSVIGNNRAWSVTVDISGVADGTHNAWVEATLGEQHATTQVQRLTIDRTPEPEEEPILAIPVVSAPARATIISTNTVTFQGTAESGSTVEVWFAGQDPVRSSVIGNDRAWSVDIDLTNVANGTHNARIQASKGAVRSANVTVEALEIRHTIVTPNDDDNTTDDNNDNNNDNNDNPGGDNNNDNNNNNGNADNNGNGDDNGRGTRGNQGNENNNNIDNASENASQGVVGRVRSFFRGDNAIPQEKVQSVADRLTESRHKTITIAGQSLDASLATLPSVVVSRESPTLQLSGQTNEPLAVVTITSYSAPLSVSTTADQQGNWTVSMDLSSKEPVETHTVTLKTRDSSGETPETTIAYFHIPSTSAIVNALPEPVATVVVAGVEGLQKATQQVVDNVVAPVATATKKAAIQTAKVTKEAAVVTHQVIVQTEPEAKATLAAVLPTITVINPPVVATIPQIPFIIYHFFTWVLSFLGIRKKRKSWGVVYDAITKEPVPLVIVRLMDVATKRLIETQVTDRSGRFGFLVKEGKYRVEVAKTGFTFPSTIVTGSIDGDYTPVYHREDMDITSGAQTVAMAIPVDPVNRTELSKMAGLKGAWSRLAGIVRKVHLPIMIAGMVISVIVALNVPSATNIAMAALYAMMAGFQYLLTPPEARPWGTVFDAQQLAPVPLALIDIIDTKYNKLLKSRLTDYNGRFAFLPPKGTYKLNVRKSGYQFPVPDVKPTRKFKNLYKGEEVVIAKDEGIIAKDIPVAKGGPAPTVPTTSATPLRTPSSPLPTPPVVIHEPHEVLLGKDHPSNVDPALNEQPEVLLGKDHAANMNVPETPPLH